MKFLDQLFPQKEAAALKTLWDDPQCAPAVARKIGEKMWRNPIILNGDPTNQLICMLETDEFEHTPEETVTVAGIVYHSFKEVNIFPYFTEHLCRLKEIDQETRSSEARERKRAEVERGFGGVCLIGLSFFPEAFDKRHNTYGYPPKEHYRGVGRQAFYRAGEHELAYNFREWENRLTSLAA